MRRKAWPDPLAICVGPSALRFSGGSVPGPSAQAGICRAFSACARMAEMEIRPRLVYVALSALVRGWRRWRFGPGWCVTRFQRLGADGGDGDSTHCTMREMRRLDGSRGL